VCASLEHPSTSTQIDPDVPPTDGSQEVEILRECAELPWTSNAQVYPHAQPTDCLHGPAQKVLLVTPEQIRPFHKAGVRKRDGKSTRKRGSTRILTDTPVKQQIENEHAIRQAKCRKIARKNLQSKL
jgi:hypothetical protein